MFPIRALLMRHRVLALVVAMTALCMKLLVPQGYMIGPDSRLLSVQICNEIAGGQLVKQIAIPMKNGGDESGSKQVKNDCPFSSLTMSSMTGAAPALLALALAFILALGFAPSPIPLPGRLFHLRPPLRGPPALA